MSIELVKIKREYLHYSINLLMRGKLRKILSESKPISQ